MSISWKKLSETCTTIGYRTIIQKQFELPNGKNHTFEILDYKQGAAGVFAITPENKVIIVRQYRPGEEKIMDDIPGGAIDPGEQPIVAAAREFEEETGYTGELEPLGTIARDAYIEGVWHYFLARNCKKISQPRLGDHEFVEIKEVDFEEVLRSTHTANISDPACILLAARKLGW